MMQVMRESTRLRNQGRPGPDLNMPLRAFRKLRWIGAVSLVVAFAASPIAADEFRTFYVDPSRSTIRFDSGDAGFQLSSDTFALGGLSAQTGATSALSGSFVASASGDFANPTGVFILPGTSDFQVANDNSIAPALDGVAGTAPAAFGVSFMDGTFLLRTNAALRDLRLTASGFLEVLSNPAGPQGLRGDLNWQIASGIADVRMDIGLAGRGLLSGVIHQAAGVFQGFVFSSSSQLTEISPGEYELRLPFGFNASGSSVPGPIVALSVLGSLDGEIVATTIPVPEPSAAWTALASLLTLGVLRATRAAR
jgi:hypothetical protein